MEPITAATLSTVFAALAKPAQDLVINAAGNLIGTLGCDPAKGKLVMGAVYWRWKKGLLDSVAGREFDAAYADFFGRESVRRELKKAAGGDYGAVDFALLEVEMRASCRAKQCPLPDEDLYSLLAEMLESLMAVTGKKGAQVERLRDAPGYSNHSVARREYLRRIVEDHQRVILRGFERVADIEGCELDQVFVMPRVRKADAKEDDEGAAAREVLAEGRKAVVLGKPGAGKSTLLVRFAVGMARGEAGYPKLLPVFYRARDLRKDRAKGASLLECFRARLAEENLLLPAGFFDKAMREDGLALLVDGMDEVVDDAEREELMRQVHGLARGLGKQSVAIVSSRPYEFGKTPVFAAEEYPRFELLDFHETEIQAFIQGWRSVRETSAVAARAANRELWEAIREHAYLREMAGTPLLLTMIVCVHLWKGQLPDSRVQLYRVCAESLVDTWSTSAGLGMAEISQTQKLAFLAELAFGMQDGADAKQMKPRGFWETPQPLEIHKTELLKRLREYLKREGIELRHADRLMERFHAREAILLHYGEGMFRFLHRSFQEYFAARWLVENREPGEIRALLDRDGWRETVALAVALLQNKNQRQRFLVDLLREQRAEDALACLPGPGVQMDGWLGDLVRCLAKHKFEGRHLRDHEPAECLDAGARGPVLDILRAIFQAPSDGAVLAAAVGLAERLTMSGDAGAGQMVTEFLERGKLVDREMVTVDAGELLYGDEKPKRVSVGRFEMDKYPVTNGDYRKMVPGHRSLPGFDGDDQPVVMVEWFAAALYARWRGCELPTEQMWEKAASWDAKKGQKREYPWGKWQEGRCNTDEAGIGKTTPVTRYPNGASPYGCFDMAGNVWEWTSSDWSTGSGTKVLRGGAFRYDRRLARCAVRILNGLPEIRSYDIGFRCART